MIIRLNIHTSCIWEDYNNQQKQLMVLNPMQLITTICYSYEAFSRLFLLLFLYLFFLSLLFVFLNLIHFLFFLIDLLFLHFFRFRFLFINFISILFSFFRLKNFLSSSIFFSSASEHLMIFPVTILFRKSSLSWKYQVFWKDTNNHNIIKINHSD